MTTTKPPVQYLTCAETAKLVRVALAERFPGVKFSVKSHTYSGGASINVRWTDGPTTKQVEHVAKRFEGATFDGMVDLKSYHDSQHNGVTVSFGADFVFCQRLLSVALLQRVGSREAKRFGLPCPKISQGAFGHAEIERDYSLMVGADCLADHVIHEAYDTEG